MVKQLQKKAGPYKKSPLVIFGWLAFFGSFLIAQPLWVALLQTVARVLPQMLSQYGMRKNIAMQINIEHPLVARCLFRC